jgi:hypothetical protein
VADLISIIEADADLGDLLSASERERASREALTRVRRLAVGTWRAVEAFDPDVHHRGFLIVDGLLSREVEVLGRRAVELLGPGDVLRPWGWDPEGSHVQAEVEWKILEPTRLAVLDQGLIVRIAPWPALGLELFARGTRRAHWLATVLAIAHHQRVDDRLILTLWHLADRWGKVGADGVIIPLPLPHQRLAHLIGAHRPSVTTATGALIRANRLKRRDDGTWVLLGRPPDEMGNHRLIAALG